ncbi:unnamed protein product [Gongylonema pulchrum]|uniref:Uncharacterized protein n=1 Tax=Gongylonema pulchrum TaxID=637853 RepID=A0A183EEK5_9BILA|nr:unnamed protein product [Gongylonema pulchrum]
MGEEGMAEERMIREPGGLPFTRMRFKALVFLWSTASSSTAVSRPLLPYVTHYSDSGFSSTLSSGSSCSFLPPPPPYRGFRGSAKQQHRIHRSLSDSKYGSTTGCHLMRLPAGPCAGSVNLQELCRAPRASSWTSRVSTFLLLHFK